MPDFRDRRSVLRAGVALCSLPLAGCLGDDDSGDETAPEELPSNGTDGNGTQDDVTDGNVTDADGGDPEGNRSDGEEPGDGDDPDWETIERWPQHQFDAQNTGYVHANTSVEGLEERWRVETDARLSSTPVVADDTAYIRDTQGIAYAMSGGEIQWSTELGGGAIFGMPVLYENVVIFLAEGRLVALDRADGEEVWEFSPEETPRYPMLADDAVFFVNSSNEMYAVEAGTGEQRWETVANQGRFYRYPAIHDEEVFVPGGGSDAPQISGLNLYEGWQRPAIQPEVEVNTGLTIRDDIVFFGSDDGVYGYSLDGTQEWYYPTEHVVDNNLAATNDTLFLISISDDVDGEVKAVTIDEGEQRWAARCDRNVAPIVVGETVLLPKDRSRVSAYDATDGEELWTTEAAFGPYSVSFANGHYYLASVDRVLYCFEPT